MANQDYSTQRLSQRYRFADPNMDLFFLAALGWGPAGGLSAGEAFYIASQIRDGDADSWADAFEKQGEILHAEAREWQQRGLARAVGEASLKAFACYRSAWQFVAPGERFIALFTKSQLLFDQAMTALNLTAIRFSVPYGGGELPGHFYPASDPAAPTVLVIGGADTCHEDRFLSQGRYYAERGYAVALVDLPGQGIVQQQGLHWEVEVEKPIAAVLDELIMRFAVRKVALLGMSLGGYFACRAAAYEPRLAAVIATPALTCPYELFSGVAKQMEENSIQSAAALRNHQVLMWKAGVSDLASLGSVWEGVRVNPAHVHVPFLSVLGMQEGSIWKKQTNEWHAAIPSSKKK
uniref:alpha/beta hydrolase family protein n=1 Tax=Chitinophaga sancti TaxID=1004 RepID=UPI003F79BC21